MFLYLTSTAANVLDKLLPHLPKSPKNMTAAFIPTASKLYDANKKPWIDEDKKKLIELGFQVEELDIENRTQKELERKLNDKDIIFVAGGNTFYLLEKARKSGFENIVKKLVKRGTIYIGSSAGSAIAGPDIEAIKALDDPKKAQLENTKGFGFVDFVVLPHTDGPDYGPHFKEIYEEYDSRYKFKELKDNQAILIKGIKMQVFNS